MLCAPGFLHCWASERDKKLMFFGGIRHSPTNTIVEGYSMLPKERDDSSRTCKVIDR